MQRYYQFYFTIFIEEDDNNKAFTDVEYSIDFEKVTGEKSSN